MRLVKFHNKEAGQPIVSVNPTQITHVLPAVGDNGREITVIYLTDGEIVRVPFVYGDVVARIESAMR